MCDNTAFKNVNKLLDDFSKNKSCVKICDESSSKSIDVLKGLAKRSVAGFLKF